MLWGEFILCIAFQSRVFASYYHTLGCRIIIWTKSCKSLIHWRTNFINILGPKCFLLGTFGSEIFSCAYFVSPNFLSWVLCGSKIFSRGQFVGPKVFIVVTSLARKILSWVLCGLWVLDGSDIFRCGYFAGPKVFIVGTLWVGNFSLRVFRRSKIFLVGTSWVRNFLLLWIFHGS